MLHTPLGVGLPQRGKEEPNPCFRKDTNTSSTIGTQSHFLSLCRVQSAAFPPRVGGAHFSPAPGSLKSILGRWLPEGKASTLLSSGMNLQPPGEGR